VLIGFVDEVNGPGAVECDGYRPTAFELGLLARHWADAALDPLIFSFLYDSWGSSESRRTAYAGRRLRRLAGVIGQQAVDEAVAAVEKQLRQDYGLDDRLWEIYRRGDPDEWARIQEANNLEVMTSREARDRRRYREAAHLVAAYRSGHGRPLEFYLEQGQDGQDGRVAVRWEGGEPGRTWAVIRCAFAGALAEAKFIATETFGEDARFDPDAPVEGLLDPGAGRDEVLIAFLDGGASRPLAVASGPFRDARAALDQAVAGGLVEPAEAADQLRLVRQRLDDPRLWAEVCHVAERLADAPTWEARRTGFRGERLAGLLAELDGPAALRTKRRGVSDEEVLSEVLKGVIPPEREGAVSNEDDLSAPGRASREGVVTCGGADDKDAEERVGPPANQPPETRVDGGSDIGVNGHDGAGDQGRSPYEPSREDLRILVRHWYERFLDIRLFEFFYARTSGAEHRGKLEANYNLERLAQALGPEAVQEVVGEVEDEARRRVGEENWRVFTRGTREERQRAQDETQAVQDYVERKRWDRETRRRALACLTRDPWGVYRDADGDLWTWGEVYGGGRRPKRPRLLLVVTTRQGWKAFVPGGSLKRPPGWYSPFGLGRVRK
jgi:hypothetical protein